MSEGGGRRRVRRQRKGVPENQDAGVRSSVESVGEAVGEEKGEGKDDGKPAERTVPRVRISTEGEGKDGVEEEKPVEQEAAGASKITPRITSPKREKPPVTPTTDSREDDRGTVDRSKGRTLPNTISNMFLDSWLVNRLAIGYRLGPQSRQDNQDVLLGPGDASRFLQLCVTTLRMDTTNFVRPAVRVHAVYKDSGTLFWIA